MNTEQAWLFDNGDWSRIESHIHQYWNGCLGGTEETRERAIAHEGYDLDSKTFGYAPPISFSLYLSIENSTFYGYFEVCKEGSDGHNREGIYVKDLPGLLYVRNLLAPGTKSNVRTFVSRELV